MSRHWRPDGMQPGQPGGEPSDGLLVAAPARQPLRVVS